MNRIQLLRKSYNLHDLLRKRISNTENSLELNASILEKYLEVVLKNVFKNHWKETTWLRPIVVFSIMIFNKKSFARGKAKG
jgi:hypothetical protein